MRFHPVHLTRRRFLKGAAAAAAVAGLPAWFLHRDLDELSAAEPPRSPNDMPGIALIGCGGQGRGDAHAARKFGRIVAVCDVDKKNLDRAAQELSLEGKRPAMVGDFREILTREDVDVVLNGTPDHWHTLINLAAVKAGKDIYCEKPLTLAIDEGKRLVQAVRERKTIFQTGSQQRSDSKFRLACELVRNGRVGALREIVVGLPTGPRDGPFPVKPVPPELNWDFYLGPTPKVPYNGHNAHWNFRWWYQFSGGQMTDWGAHHHDIAQWANNTERSGPIEVEGRSLVDMIPGGYDAAAEFEIQFKYANGVNLRVTDGHREPNGVKFVGPEGWIFVSRSKIEASNSDLIEESLPGNATRLYRSDNHMANFFECVRTRQAPICDAEIGHRSISVAHLGVIAVQTHRRLQWDPEGEQFVGVFAAEANPWLSREMRAPYDYSMVG